MIFQSAISFNSIYQYCVYLPDCRNCCFDYLRCGKYDSDIAEFTGSDLVGSWKWRGYRIPGICGIYNGASPYESQQGIDYCNVGTGRGNSGRNFSVSGNVESGRRCRYFDGFCSIDPFEFTGENILQIIFTKISSNGGYEFYISWVYFQCRSKLTSSLFHIGL